MTAAVETRDGPTFAGMDSERPGEWGQAGAGRHLPRLTRTELAVLSAVDDLIAELGYAPTYREMLARLGWSPKSKGSLHQYLGRLRRLGVIEGSGRSLRIISRPDQNDRSDRGSRGDENAG
jgi:hypothetical protein